MVHLSLQDGVMAYRMSSSGSPRGPWWAGAPWDPLWYVLARRSNRCLPPAARLGGPSVVCIEAASLGALSQSQMCAWMTQTKEERLYVTEWSWILGQGPNCVSIYILPSQWNEPWLKQSLLCLTRGAVSNISGDREERQRPLLPPCLEQWEDEGAMPVLSSFEESFPAFL